jgi:hypothetical protein
VVRPAFSGRSANVIRVAGPPGWARYQRRIEASGQLVEHRPFVRLVEDYGGPLRSLTDAEILRLRFREAAVTHRPKHKRFKMVVGVGYDEEPE